MSGDLTVFQHFLMEQVNQCWIKHQHARTPMLLDASEYASARTGSENMAALKEEHVDVLCEVGQTRQDETKFVIITVVVYCLLPIAATIFPIPLPCNV